MLIRALALFQLLPCFAQADFPAPAASECSVCPTLTVEPPPVTVVVETSYSTTALTTLTTTSIAGTQQKKRRAPLRFCRSRGHHGHADIPGYEQHKPTMSSRFLMPSGAPQVSATSRDVQQQFDRDHGKTFASTLLHVSSIQAQHSAEHPSAAVASFTLSGVVATPSSGHHTMLSQPASSLHSSTRALLHNSASDGLSRISSASLRPASSTTSSSHLTTISISCTCTTATTTLPVPTVEVTTTKVVTVATIISNSVYVSTACRANPTPILRLQATGTLGPRGPVTLPFADGYTVYLDPPNSLGRRFPRLSERSSRFDLFSVDGTTGRLISLQEGTAAFTFSAAPGLVFGEAGSQSFFLTCFLSGLGVPEAPPDGDRAGLNCVNELGVSDFAVTSANSLNFQDTADGVSTALALMEATCVEFFDVYVTTVSLEIGPVIVT